MDIDEVEKFCLSGGHKYAYFYCDFRNSDSQDPKCLVGSLVGQLAMQYSEMSKVIRNLYEERRTGNAGKKEPAHALSGLAEETSGQCRSYIIIDTLDECEMREELLNRLVEIHSKSALRLNIL